jgi:hypothetical protein
VRTPRLAQPKADHDWRPRRCQSSRVVGGRHRRTALRLGIMIKTAAPAAVDLFSLSSRVDRHRPRVTMRLSRMQQAARVRSASVNTLDSPLRLRGAELSLGDSMIGHFGRVDADEAASATSAMPSWPPCTAPTPAAVVPTEVSAPTPGRRRPTRGWASGGHSFSPWRSDCAG